MSWYPCGVFLSRSWNLFFSILPRSVPLGSYSVSSEDSIRADAGCSLRDSAVGFLYSLSFWDNSVALPRYFAQRYHPIDFWLICQVEFSFVLIEAFSPCSQGARRYWIPLLFDCLHFFLIVLFILYPKRVCPHSQESFQQKRAKTPRYARICSRFHNKHPPCFLIYDFVWFVRSSP